MKPGPLRGPLLFLLASIAWTGARADSSDVPQWYGTITFSKSLTSRATETYAPGHAHGPGTELTATDVAWSGTARFLPGRKQVVIASYTFTRTRDRRTDRLGPCPWKTEKTASHDYELMEERTRVSVNRQLENSDLKFRVAEDGSYRGNTIVSGGNHVPKAARVHARREQFTECSKPHLTVHDEVAFESAGMESLTLNHIEGKTKPGAKTLSGTFTRPDDDGGKLTYSWNLTLAEPVLVARIQATPVRRGDSVTLNASASTGPITRYEWEFTPEGDCQMTREGLAVRLTGVSVSFKALCDFTAKLTVSNANATDSSSLPVVVEARQGAAWTTKFKSAMGEVYSASVNALAVSAGKNQCSFHPAAVASGHWLHTEDTGNRTWSKGGYVQAQVTDTGPFKGAWYVQSQTLRVDRQERANKELLKGGSIYQMNLARNNLPDIEIFATQIAAHEKAHSELVEELLKRLGPDGDPAARIEKLVGGAGEAGFLIVVDMQVQEVDSAMFEASADVNVANRLRADGRFARAIDVWVPGSLEPSGAQRPDFKKPLGPLWAIGD